MWVIENALKLRGRHKVENRRRRRGEDMVGEQAGRYRGRGRAVVVGSAPCPTADQAWTGRTRSHLTVGPNNHTIGAEAVSAAARRVYPRDGDRPPAGLPPPHAVRCDWSTIERSAACGRASEHLPPVQASGNFAVFVRAARATVGNRRKRALEENPAGTRQFETFRDAFELRPTWLCRGPSSNFGQRRVDEQVQPPGPSCPPLATVHIVSAGTTD
ncbi:uncharacterized protein PSFLO_04863 [Pseudozyma flocculosa]|uniref:Uncharacterized protein n=1 Tax=Pseudozyma flocculosa TaxID=84751 RepID=A0A5C3F4V2_9BASI|nr:uncharacterized protein PSFLO_04863 [Pseudozyma flocculosa]